MAIVEKIAEGQLLKDITKKPGMPNRTTFYRWVIKNPDLAQAYNAAIALSAHTLEEDALELARTIKGDTTASGTKVRAFEVAMAQFRWSAERRDPARYANRTAGTLVVPIQINTTLDLKGGISSENVYKVESVIDVPVEKADGK